MSNEFFEAELNLCRDAIFEWLKGYLFGPMQKEENLLKELYLRFPGPFKKALAEAELSPFEWMED